MAKCHNADATEITLPASTKAGLYPLIASCVTEAAL